MKSFVLVLFSAFAASTLGAQCLTGFTKLLPEPSIDYSLEFGRSVSMFDDYLAVGIPNSDSLGRITGIVEIYKKNSSNRWDKVASLAPSDPADALQFGYTVKMSKNYLLVGATGGGGKVYVFKKPAAGWMAQTELMTFSVTGARAFGVSANTPIDISEDEQTIAIVDQFYIGSSVPPYRFGAVFVFNRAPGQEWTDSVVPVRILAPENDATDFGRAGVSIYGDRLATGSPFSASANGKIFVWRILLVCHLSVVQGAAGS